MFSIVGNAAFHSRELYPVLSPCLQGLSMALSNQDEKTRANAAGAIGNLVRNSGELCKDIAEIGIVELLLRMVTQDSDITTQRIALFSVGTMAVYEPIR
jgi:fused-like protein